jgi:hypothetical protein
MSVSGTIRKVTLNGITYDVPADINITFNRSNYETEGMATSGRTLYKKTRRVQTMESVVLITDPSEAEQIEAAANGLADVTMAVELADGTVYRSAGQINYGSFESEENRSNLTLIPNKSSGNPWTPFIP